ncbi:RNase P/MRP, p29 subunit [Tothia fuscella]|uniref:Ribonuclease P protein subunit n=1 Tax=Tothia fuscella TaxID=1048955 RepID=A0A9P4NNI8_9PEZI|nr:RNase P/MRP, p29 subunit [Tothia fuscella]
MSTPKKKPLIALDLLTRSQKDPSDALEIFKTKILERPLFLKPTSPSERTTSDARSSRQKVRSLEAQKTRKNPGKPRPLSAKQKRALQIYAIPKPQQKYEIYIPLHRMWCGYIREILGIDIKKISPEGYGRFVEPKGAGPLLASADYHGALVEVVRSRCVSRVGLRGIVLRDSKFTFEVVTRGNEVKVVPKEHTVFGFEVPLFDGEEEGKEGDGVVGEGEGGEVERKFRPFRFEIHGHAFEARAPERVTRKVAPHIPKDL